MLILRRKEMQGLKSVNLSLSVKCGADCIYCPSDRGQNLKIKTMPFDIVKKIVDEIATEEFKEKHDIQCMELSENGDCFFNPDLIKIMRYIKEKMPWIKTEMFTNFQLFSKEKSETMLKEKLIDNVCFNIDGHNETNYFAVKKISLKTVKKNLFDFIETRNKYDSNVGLVMYILSLQRYVKEIKGSFGFSPTKLKERIYDVIDNSRIIPEQFQAIMDPSKDKILISHVMGWAERKKIDAEIDYSKYECTFLKRIRKEAFIAPDGSWYSCCLDSKPEHIFGNVMQNSLDEIFNSRKRKDFITKLELKKFKELGGPCATVVCC